MSAPIRDEHRRRNEMNMSSLGRFNTLTTAVVAALALSAVLDVVGVVSDVSYRSVIERALSGARISLREADAADYRQQLIGWWQAGVFLAAAVLFLIWFRRANKNVRVLGVDGPRRWLSARPRPRFSLRRTARRLDRRRSRDERSAAANNRFPTAMRT
jgi:hypothetical protein